MNEWIEHLKTKEKFNEKGHYFLAILNVEVE